jgi:hypothetical protein
VKKIVVHGSKVTMEHVGWKYEPQGLTSAQLNLPYCVATWLIEGDCFVDQFTEDKVADPARMALAEKGGSARRTRPSPPGGEVPAHGARRGALERRHGVEAHRGSRDAAASRKFASD